MKTKYIVENNLKNDIAIYDFPEKNVFAFIIFVNKNPTPHKKL